MWKSVNSFLELILLNESGFSLLFYIGEKKEILGSLHQVERVDRAIFSIAGQTEFVSGSYWQSVQILEQRRDSSWRLKTRWAAAVRMHSRGRELQNVWEQTTRLGCVILLLSIISHSVSCISSISVCICLFLHQFPMFDATELSLLSFT